MIGCGRGDPSTRTQACLLRMTVYKEEKEENHSFPNGASFGRSKGSFDFARDDMGGALALPMLLSKMCGYA